MPDSHYYVGPAVWSPAGCLPDWWITLPQDRPIVYVTLGSSGYGSLLQVVLEALANAPVTVIAACAGKVRPGKIPANAFVADYLPGGGGRAACRTCDMQRRGSLTCYQALAHGKPVIGIPANLDQYLNMQYIETTGVGQLLRAGAATAPNAVELVHEILGSPAYAAKAHELMQAISAYPSQTVFDQVLDRAFAGRTSDQRN